MNFAAKACASPRQRRRSFLSPNLIGFVPIPPRCYGHDSGKIHVMNYFGRSAYRFPIARHLQENNTIRVWCAIVQEILLAKCTGVTTPRNINSFRCCFVLYVCRDLKELMNIRRGGIPLRHFFGSIAIILLSAVIAALHPAICKCLFRRHFLHSL